MQIHACGTHVEWDSQKEVLRIACKWALNAGLSLTRWLFERGRLRYDVALRILLSEAIDHDRHAIALADIVYRYLLLPFDAAPDAKLLAKLAQRLIATQPARRAEIVTALSAHIQIYAVPSSRKRLLRFLETATTFSGAEQDDATPGEDDDTISSTPITYEVDGAKLTEAEVIQRVVSVEAVRTLVNALNKSFYSWERALEPLVRRAGDREVLQLAELFAESERSSLVLSLLARRLVELGRPREAFDLGERAFRQTQPSGWQQYWDGGTRLRALEALALVDRRRAQELGFDTLIDELAAGTADGGPLAVELIRILPLLTDTLPAASIWLEVTWFLEALFAHAGQLERPRLTPAARSREDQASADARCLGQWVMEYVDHPANALSRSAQRAVIELLQHGNETLQVLMRDYLSKDPTELGLITLSATAFPDAQVLAPFREQLCRLVCARHFGVRRLANRLCESLPAGVAAQMAARTPTDRTLPPAYDLTYPPSGSARRILDVPVSSQEFLPPTEDAAELIDPWRPEADLIARVANVQPEALYRRAAELMVELGGADFDDAERKLRQGLDGMELKLVFRRPRAALGRRALGVATTELVDAGRVPEAALESLDLILRAGDPAMLRCRPGLRPSWIAAIHERANAGYYSSGWEAQVSTTQSALVQPEETVDGVVVAEETHLRWLEWDRPEEIRVGACVGGVPPASFLDEDDPLLRLCAEWRHELVADYDTLDGATKHLVGVQNGFRFETPGNRWLAFNPSVARSLGWVCDSEGLFRWRDSSGAVMVETLLWQDGLYDQQPPKPKVEVGWGWIVKASSAGWAHIRHAYNVRSRCVCVMRRSQKVQPHRATALSTA